MPLHQVIIHDNYPEYSYDDIRKMLAQRKHGKEVDIPDVVWQNPSLLLGRADRSRQANEELSR